MSPCTMSEITVWDLCYFGIRSFAIINWHGVTGIVEGKNGTLKRKSSGVMCNLGLLHQDVIIYNY